MLHFPGVTYFFTGGIVKKIGVHICRNSFSRRNKYVHIQEVVSTSSFDFVKRLRSTFC